jgi:Zn-dependent peptidase ImmA (M78 family)
MAIEEAGPNSERLAEAILAQLVKSNSAIPIVEIAHALDIFEIHYENLESYEGSLLTTPERDIGSILVNAKSGKPRRRFTIAHELGHYLNWWQKPHDEVGFVCSNKDFRVGNFIAKPALTAHEVQELRANRFAIELLAPKNRIFAISSADPTVADVLRIATQLELSKEAAARRYVELHPGKIAVVFTQNGEVRYAVKSSKCSNLAIRTGQRLLSPSDHQSNRISHEEIEVDLPTVAGQARSKTAEAETLHQEGGHAFTILNFDQSTEAAGGDEDAGIEDTFERFSRF